MIVCFAGEIIQDRKASLSKWKVWRFFVFFSIFIFWIFSRVFSEFVPHSTFHGVYISQLIRFARESSHVDDFNTRNKVLTANFLKTRI